jgi:hypothetical protein
MRVWFVLGVAFFLMAVAWTLLMSREDEDVHPPRRPRTAVVPDVTVTHECINDDRTCSAWFGHGSLGCCGR